MVPETKREVNVRNCSSKMMVLLAFCDAPKHVMDTWSAETAASNCPSVDQVTDEAGMLHIQAATCTSRLGLQFERHDVSHEEIYLSKLSSDFTSGKASKSVAVVPRRAANAEACH